MNLLWTEKAYDLYIRHQVKRIKLYESNIKQCDKCIEKYKQRQRLFASKNPDEYQKLSCTVSDYEKLRGFYESQLITFDRNLSETIIEKHKAEYK